MLGRATVGMLTLAAAACGHATALSADVTPPVVTTRLFQFRPPALTVTVGTRVVWRNEDDILHTVTSLTGVTPGSGFRRVLDGKGSSIDLTFTEPGAYAYACERHPHMRGEVRVEAREPAARRKGDRS
jgi:plastocyanin